MAWRWLSGWPSVFPRISVVTLDRWEMAGRSPVAFEHPIQQDRQSTKQIQCKCKPEPNGWVASAVYFNNISRVKLDRHKMVEWLSLAISEDFGCNSRSLQDGWEMTGWLAPTSSNYFGCNFKSPRDGWVVGPSYFR